MSFPPCTCPTTWDAKQTVYGHWAGCDVVPLKSAFEKIELAAMTGTDVTLKGREAQAVLKYLPR
jgi:hypothetical protein